MASDKEVHARFDEHLVNKSRDKVRPREEPARIAGRRRGAEGEAARANGRRFATPRKRMAVLFRAAQRSSPSPPPNLACITLDAAH